MNGKRTQGLARWLFILFCAGGGGLYAAPAAAPPAAPPPTPSTAVGMVDNITELLEGAIDQLEIVEADAEALKATHENLLIENKDEKALIQGLRIRLDEHAARVQQLGDRYSKVLTLAQKMKKDMEFSTTMNYVLGGTAVVAVLVAVGEALALAGRR